MADSAGVDFDEELVWAGGGDLDLFDDEFCAGLFGDGGFHCFGDCWGHGCCFWSQLGCRGIEIEDGR